MNGPYLGTIIDYHTSSTGTVNLLAGMSCSRTCPALKELPHEKSKLTVIAHSTTAHSVFNSVSMPSFQQNTSQWSFSHLNPEAALHSRHSTLRSPLQQPQCNCAALNICYCLCNSHYHCHRANDGLPGIGNCRGTDTQRS